jgi:cytoplasmic iron level regulating protein YaaA (DUF328/UPF0246 family)
MDNMRNHETHAESILSAVAALVREQSKKTFTRRDVRRQIGITQEEWMRGFTAIFQAMRMDQPGGAPVIAKKYQNVFKRISKGNYFLADYGKMVVSQIDKSNPGIDHDIKGAKEIGKSNILFIIIGSNHKRRGGENKYDESKSLAYLLPYHKIELVRHRKEAFDLLRSGKPFRNSIAVKDYPFNAYLKDGKEFGGTASASYMEAAKRFDGRFYQEISKNETVRLSKFKDSGHHFLIVTPLYGLALPEEYIQAHNFHLPDHEDISKLWTKNGFLTSLVLAYIDKYKIKKVFDFTASQIYRKLLNWNRISKKLDLLHAFGSENSGPDLLPALGRLLESRFFSESEEELLRIFPGESLNADYEDVIFCSAPIPPEGYPKEKSDAPSESKKGDILDSGLGIKAKNDAAECIEHPNYKRVLVTTGEHHSPFGENVESIEDLPDSIRPIFYKISQVEHVTAIYFGNYTSKHSRIGPKIFISGYEKNSGHILGHLTGNFKRASKINVDFKVTEGKELETLKAIKRSLGDLRKFGLLINR